MGSKDSAVRDYFDDYHRFVDVINGFYFEGKEVLKAEALSEMDSTGFYTDKKYRGKREQLLYRDIIRKVAFDTQFVLFGIEEQSHIHYAMPVRTLLYDALSYKGQTQQIAYTHRVDKDLTGDEFLSGIAKTDKLWPVITTVIYWGEKPWDGPRELMEMLQMEHLPEELKNKVNNYKLHILEVRKYGHIERFQTDLRLVFGFLQNAANAENLMKFVTENEAEFKSIPEDAFHLLDTMENIKGLKKIRNEKGEIDMCRALDELYDKGMKLGEARGIEVGEEKRARIAAKNMYHRGYKTEEVAGLLEIPEFQVKNWYQEWS